MTTFSIGIAGYTMCRKHGSALQFLWVVIGALVLTAQGPRVGHSQSGVLTKDQLDTLERATEVVCGKFQLSGSSKTIALDGQAKAELDALLKKLADLSVSGSAKLNIDEYSGLLRNELGPELKDVRDCRRRIWDDLKTKFLSSHQGPASPPAPSSLLATSSPAPKEQLPAANREQLAVAIQYVDKAFRSCAPQLEHLQNMKPLGGAFLDTGGNLAVHHECKGPRELCNRWLFPLNQIAVTKLERSTDNWGYNDGRTYRLDCVSVRFGCPEGQKCATHLSDGKVVQQEERWGFRLSPVNLDLDRLYAELRTLIDAFIGK